MAKAKKRVAARKRSSKRRKASAKSVRKKTVKRAMPAGKEKAQRYGEPMGRKFNEDVIRKGLQELAELYEHDYGPSMPELQPGAGFTDEREVERLGRLMGGVLKYPVAKAVKIDPAVSSTGSRYGYEFDLQELEAPEFARSDHGKIYAALLEQTKFMMDEGVAPELAGQIIERIYALSPDKRAAEFAEPDRAMAVSMEYVSHHPTRMTGRSLRGSDRVDRRSGQHPDRFLRARRQD
jgi:hypothetical protein